MTSANIATPSLSLSVWDKIELKKFTLARDGRWPCKKITGFFD